MVDTKSRDHEEQLHPEESKGVDIQDGAQPRRQNRSLGHLHISLIDRQGVVEKKHCENGDAPQSVDACKVRFLSRHVISMGKWQFDSASSRTEFGRTEEKSVYRRSSSCALYLPRTSSLGSDERS